MGGKRILAVDDEADVLKLLEKRLVAAGYEVLTTTSGKEAIQIAKAKKPDLIILDLLMPGQDGSETAAILQHDPLTQKIPILFLTCLFTKREEKLEGHQLGHNFFVAKPYNPQELIGEIEKIIALTCS